jgi:hypothetical protein
MMGAGDAFTAAITDLLLDEAAALRIGRTFWERALRCGHDAARRRILASHRARER